MLKKVSLILFPKIPKSPLNLIKTFEEDSIRMNRIATKRQASKDTHVETVNDIVILVVDDKPNIIKQISDICCQK